MDTNYLITIEQLPIIKERLEELHELAIKAVQKVLSIEVTKDNIKEVKQMRADLRKQFDAIENQRKKVKQAILKPYDEFEKLYRTSITDVYKSADAELKSRIESLSTKDVVPTIPAEPIQAPIIEETGEMYTTTFTVTATLTKLKQLKIILDSGGYTYDQK